MDSLLIDRVLGQFIEMSTSHNGLLRIHAEEVFSGVQAWLEERFAWVVVCVNHSCCAGFISMRIDCIFGALDLSETVVF